MCQAPVGIVRKVGKGEITVEHRGVLRRLDSRLVDVKEGDYVLFSLDIAIEKIEKEEAMAIQGGTE